jgi:hypothetical protein
MQQVLSTTTSASDSSEVGTNPSATSNPASRSESCSFIWHPNVRMKKVLGTAKVYGQGIRVPGVVPCPTMAAPTDRARRSIRSAQPWLGAVAVLVGAVALSGCGGSSSGGGSTGGSPSNSKVSAAGTTALNDLAHYQATAAACGTKITCIETADRTAGNQIHTYANTLGELSSGKTSTKASDLALDAAQSLANSFEILGDAQATQANYDKVMGTFNLPKAIDTLKTDIRAVS